MHPDSTPCQAHPVRHGSIQELPARRRSVTARIGVGIHCVPVGVYDSAVQRRVLVNDFFEDRVVSGGRPESLLSGRHYRPTRILPTNEDLGSLHLQIDDDAGLSVQALRVPFVERRSLPGSAAEPAEGATSTGAQAAKATRQPPIANLQPASITRHIAARRVVDAFAYSSEKSSRKVKIVLGAAA